MSGRVRIQDPDWVAANERGELLAEQRRLIAGEAQGCWILVLLLLPPWWCAFAGILATALVFVGLTAAGIPEPIGAIPAAAIGGGLVLYLLWAWWLRDLLEMARIRRDVACGRVERGEGMVGWFGGAYGARVGGRTLRFLHGPGRVYSRKADMPAPGAYDVFYLPRSRWVVSLRRTRETVRTVHRQEIRRAVAEEVPFALEALEENRRGRLTAAQAGRVRRVAVWNAALSLAMAAAAAFVGVALAWGGFAWILMAPLAFAVFHFARRAGGLWREAREGRVEKISGEADGYWRPGTRNSPSRFVLQIGGRSFEIAGNVYWAIIPFLKYDVYYLPRSDLIVSIDPQES